MDLLPGSARGPGEPIRRQFGAVKDLVLLSAGRKPALNSAQRLRLGNYGDTNRHGAVRVTVLSMQLVACKRVSAEREGRDSWLIEQLPDLGKA